MSPDVKRAEGPLLELRGVIAGYGGGDILKGVDLRVDGGGVTCIVGPNGAGKSTLLKVISGLVKPREGDILFDGQSLIDRSPRQILQVGIVQVPQNHSLFKKMTVRENVEFGGFLLRNRDLIKQRFEQIATQFPIVVEKEKEKAGSLSGGQQRLVEFARCLMLDPRLVILDEPSMGLDPTTLKRVFQTVRAMSASGRTVLLVEQNAKAGLRLADHGVVLENGLVRLTGSGREVLDHPEIGALYLGGAPVRSGR
ncbi:ABC transporter ATP-binding protein [Ferrimicrobium sp.]|uniref:ABC transporter ATP-binding protein n=1 Tax=Ferrimicrobium sp. TaxID=2926050 RepID=UPI002601C2F9|nr:ABC transporter ATP-binding protein [Ferrimicrobium sp.]